MFCKKQSGSKTYMDLYNIIDSQPLIENSESIAQKFSEKHPGKSFENTAQYLLKLVTDSLVQIGTVKNEQFQQYFCLMRSQVLFERSISEEGYKELKKAQQLAAGLQDSLIQFYGYRQELKYLSGLGFPKMTEKELVEMQMKAKVNLRQLHQIQEHSSLFEQLRYRLIYSERSLSMVKETQFNDLLISELSLITRGSTFPFEMEKNHLLFQSFFLIHTGKYKSSLESFKELNKLFENNESIWNFPPYHYLHTLEGILDNLRSIKYFNQMDFFIKKIEKLLEPKYPEHFQTTAKQIIYIYQLNILINTNKFSNAITLSESIPDALIKNEKFINYEKRVELLFHISLAFFEIEDFKNANKHMHIIKLLGKVKENSSVYRASCLMHIIIHYELNDLSFLNYEIRSYKRNFKKTGELLDLERIIFKIIKHDPKNKNNLKNLNLWNRIETNLLEINKSNYQRQILKYYDFNSWLKKKLI